MADDTIRFEMPADVRLEGTGGVFCFVQAAWEMMLQTAVDNGWKPEQLLSLYVADIGLDVSAQDARSFAVAIEKALDDAGTEQDGTDLLGALDDNREQTEALIAFCRSGGFRVISCGA